MAVINLAAAGGPVGGGMMMGNGSPANNMNMGMASSVEQTKGQLNTYIYEYLAKNGHFEAARLLLNDSKFEIKTIPKHSPGRNKNGDMNGDAGDNTDMDGKDELPDDLLKTATYDGSSGNGFLFEWFSIFFDLFTAHRNPSKTMNNQVAQYLLHHQQMQRLRENQNANIRPGGMMNQMMMRNMPNGSMDGDRKMTQMTPQQIQAMKNRQMAIQHMQRGEQPDAEMNGRPGTPADGDNGSPSKRPRLDGQQPFNNGMTPNGRPAGVPGAAGQGMLMQAGFNPNVSAAQFRQNGAMPQQVMKNNMANGMMNVTNGGSPMMNMNQFPDGMMVDMYNQQRGMQGAQAMQGSSGNHALQDYQMQLMLLEQQNKKRLMMARQEQHESNPGGGPMTGVGMQAPALSPGGSRTGSPSAGDAMQGRSPGSMNFMNGMQPPDFNNAMFMGKDQQMMAAGGPPNMRPPTSDMGGMRPQNARMNNQFQGGQPMTQQLSQGGQTMGTPNQRGGDMPPPQAPTGGPNSAQRNQTGSPSNANAPPTPSQTNKPNPKNKKAKEEASRKRPNKKNSTANAPTSDDNPPVTPQPSTPITANNSGVINAGAKGQPPMQGQQQLQNNGMQMGQPPMQNDMSQFSLNNDQFNVNLDFSTLESADVLETFDFDSFLNTSDNDPLHFDSGFGVENFGMDQSDQ